MKIIILVPHLGLTHSQERASVTKGGFGAELIWGRSKVVQTHRESIVVGKLPTCLSHTVNRSKRTEVQGERPMC